eukprot:746285-Hanusia_phi.AAC.1
MERRMKEEEEEEEEEEEGAEGAEGAEGRTELWLENGNGRPRFFRAHEGSPGMQASVTKAGRGEEECFEHAGNEGQEKCRLSFEGSMQRKEGEGRDEKDLRAWVGNAIQR